MLRDLRVKVRNRYSRISSCTYNEFLPLSKQFSDFVSKNPILTALIDELIARHQKVIEEITAAPVEAQAYGNTAEEAAAIAYTKWKRYADQGDPLEYWKHVIRHIRDGDYNEAMAKYRDWYVDPLFDYLDEVLEDANVILGTLIRYKHKVEWYRREELQNLFEGNSSQGENVLAKHMFEYLFDQGIPFQVEPRTASGRPDVVALENADDPFIGDVKVFDAGSRGATYVKKGVYQVQQYCSDKNESVAYLIIFNVSNKMLRLELPSSGDGVPRFEYGHRTVFIIVIDIHAYESSASTRGIPETVTISAGELIREMKPEEQPTRVSE